MTADTLATKRSYDRDRILGIPHSTVPADRARAHLAHLTAGGASLTSVAAATGLTRPALVNILSGQPTIRRTTAARIARTRHADILDRAAPGQLVPVIGAQRRIRALLALGHTHDAISALAGVQSWRLLIVSGPTQITAAKWRAIATTYDRLSMTPGSSATTRRRATLAGYPPPLAWDDDIDDPAARPDLGAKAHSLDLDEWCHLVSLHVNPDEAARRCGVKDVDSIEMAATRHGHARALRWLAALTLDRPMQDGQGRETVDILKARAARLRRLADEAGAAA